MLGSKNNFFSQDRPTLVLAKTNLVQLLNMKGRNSKDVEEYLEAFNYFMVHPTEFDGATVVKDLVDVRTKKGGYLDADAMLHDYEYIVGANRNFVKKWKADWKYIKGMESNGKGTRIPRMFVLTIAGIILVPYNILKKMQT